MGSRHRSRTGDPSNRWQEHHQLVPSGGEAGEVTIVDAGLPGFYRDPIPELRDVESDLHALRLAAKVRGREPSEATGSPSPGGFYLQVG